ncbi:restriction endonuclease fold toxin 5 domain-containing protein (plasmid) [Xenorhabdus stockiae]|uniref:restriction endonuclease fold toxin 5 domain-containing protein n=1 Tax=Xenorhabdus stockiae TaxID=351614 RepID=UPI003CEBF4A0
MPAPLVLGAPAAGAALVAAAEWTLAACVAGLVAIGIMEGTKEKEEADEKDKAESRTDAISTTREKCDECPAIDQVVVVWEKCSSYSDITIEYQTRIAGTTYKPELGVIQTWLCQTVNFDGWKPGQCLFLEAKANYEQFFEDGEPKWFFAKFKKKPTDKTGLESMMSQASRQNGVCISLSNIPKSHWHFLQSVPYEYFSEAFSPFSNIKTFHTP